jgi:hypothetical protein
MDKPNFALVGKFHCNRLTGLACHVLSKYIIVVVSRLLKSCICCFLMPIVRDSVVYVYAE